MKFIKIFFANSKKYAYENLTNIIFADLNIRQLYKFNALDYKNIIKSANNRTFSILFKRFLLECVKKFNYVIRNEKLKLIGRILLLNYC